MTHEEAREQQEATKPEQNVAPAAQYEASLLPDMLPVYYSRIFPSALLCRWLACGAAPQPLAHRELSFTLAEDVYLRYLSAAADRDLQHMLHKKVPHKIDIGAVYNTKPSIARHGSVVLARELVFDIDLTDYDDIRTCCQEARVCQKCWKFMAVACEILDKALRDDFGFRHILWVFSGRRGVHCWVSDLEARTLDSPGRAAVADYLCLVIGGDNQRKKVNLGSENIHTSIKRAHSIVEGYFDDILSDQQFLSTPEGLNKFISMIQDEGFAAKVEKKLDKLQTDSTERWKAFTAMYDSYCKENGSATRKIKYLLEEIRLQYTYPRLDVNVSKGFNHLLKSPFSIHPKTGMVCVVFKPALVKSFRLEEVPTIYTLLDDASSENAIHKINMRQAVKNFQEVVFGLEKEEAKRRRKEAGMFN